ncbi:DNA (cytosine-5)-methyltransferase 1 [Acorus calamus]|uniref:DNA (Cytosine-5)-methyltransferase 1 n=1 Tax=Acorus calamus TaxID=4465 RepID=A0AAV9D437_ACOCL|nr:DNA (cytosine-5)-methyltransferase 1 [Acorus calamus]
MDYVEGPQTKFQSNIRSLSQDHVASCTRSCAFVRENARLQGFPDCYKFFGPMKEHYIQIGIDLFLLLVSLDAPSEWPTEV